MMLRPGDGLLQRRDDLSRRIEIRQPLRDVHAAYLRAEARHLADDGLLEADGTARKDQLPAANSLSEVHRPSPGATRHPLPASRGEGSRDPSPAAAGEGAAKRRMRGRQAYDALTVAGTSASST